MRELREFVRRRRISCFLILPALVVQVGIMGWAHLHVEGGLGNFTCVQLVSCNIEHEFRLKPLISVESGSCMLL